MSYNVPGTMPASGSLWLHQASSKVITVKRASPSRKNHVVVTVGTQEAELKLTQLYAVDPTGRPAYLPVAVIDPSMHGAVLGSADEVLRGEALAVIRHRDMSQVREASRGPILQLLMAGWKLKP